MKRMTTLVDTPGPFDTLATWESYLTELKTLTPDDFIPGLIANAEDVIADLKAGRKPDLSKTG